MSFLRDVLEDLLGSYQPVIYEVQEGEILNECIPSGAAGVDWPWVASAALLILMVYSIFRIVRCLIAK